MNLLTRTEEFVLLMILKLGNEAYGVSIRNRIHSDTGQLWSFASIYQPLNKLLRRGYVMKVPGEATPERGGKKKYYYHLTSDGKTALQEIRNTQNQIWADAPEIL
ncbi:PadR family transcriptional regulator [bacterium]|nr:PadR family transcriptional regulator [bacterium]